MEEREREIRSERGAGFTFNGCSRHYFGHQTGESSSVTLAKIFVISMDYESNDIKIGYEKRSFN